MTRSDWDICIKSVNNQSARPSLLVNSTLLCLRPSSAGDSHFQEAAVSEIIGNKDLAKNMPTSPIHAGVLKHNPHKML